MAYLCNSSDSHLNDNGSRTSASGGVGTRSRLLWLAWGAVLLSAWIIGCGGGGGNNPPVTPITITTLTLNGGTVKTTYNVTLAATGGSGTYTWSLSSGSNLPAGLALSAAGVISGTPTTAGLNSFSVDVQDSETSPQTASASLKLAISGGNLAITAPLPVAGQVGVSYSFQLSAQGGVPPYTWSTVDNTTLPAGLSLSAGGLLTGTPTAAGNSTVDFQVTDSANISLSQNVPMTINPAGQSFQPS